MIYKNAASFFVILFLASCEKREQHSPQPKAQENPRVSRLERHSAEIPGTRGKMRSALDLARALEPGEAREKALAQVAWDTLESAPDIAAQAILEMQADTDEKDRLIQAYAGQLAKEDPNAALAWGSSLDSGREIGLIREQVALVLKESDPKRALGLFPESGFTTDGMNPSAEQIFQTWMSQSPQDATAWVTSIPSDEARKVGLERVFSQWMQTDTDAALKWATSQGNVQRHQEIVSAIATAVVGQPDPIREVFLERAEPDLRSEIQEKISESSHESEAVPNAE